MSKKDSLKKPRREAAWRRILRLFQERFPDKVNTKDIERVADISDYQRRIRELRADGWDILSHHDDQELKADEYRLGSLTKGEGYQFARRIDAKTRAFVLQRNGFTCTACGRGVGDEDPITPGRNVVLNIDHIDPDGESVAVNLQVLCSACNVGKQDLILQHSALNLLRAIRRASTADQQSVMKWLKIKFESDK